MPSPSSSSSITNVSLTYSQNIDALLNGSKWGGVAGTGAILAYSFPWASGGNATFSGHNGVGNYSSLNEQNATYHYALNATQQAAARAALQTWANVADIGFQEIGDTATNVGDIRFAFTSAPKLTSTGEQAWGWASYPDSYWPSAGDVWISTLNTGASNTNWSVGSYNYNSLIHETGHALGLKHPFEGPTLLPTLLDNRQYSVMSYTNPPNDLFRTITYTANGFTSFTGHVPCETPMVLDIAAIQTLYGANMAYHTGDDVYSFDTATPFFKTIWDAGGNDTISVSSFTENCRIDLTPGNYSSIRMLSVPIPAGYTVTGGTAPTYDGTNNLGIAYGTIIENAIGGGGNDTLVGNDASNSLDGGAGNDTLNGGAGNDTFDWNPSWRAGNDTFYGGAGNDVYVLDTVNDSVVEYSGEGIDTIFVNFSFSLSSLPYVEELGAFGSNGVSLTGNSANNVILGASGNDILNGGAGTDTLNGGLGNDTLNGGDGNDTAIFSGTRASHLITGTSTGYTVSDEADGTEGTDAVTNVERLSFTDGTIRCDVSQNQLAVARLYQAVMGRAPDFGGLDYWAAQRGSGMTTSHMALGFMASAEYSTRYGSPDNPTFVNLLYHNVLGRDAEPAGRDYWDGVLGAGVGRADVIAGFADSVELTGIMTARDAGGVFVV